MQLSRPALHALIVITEILLVHLRTRTLPVHLLPVHPELLAQLTSPSVAIRMNGTANYFPSPLPQWDT